MLKLKITWIILQGETHWLLKKIAYCLEHKAEFMVDDFIINNKKYAAH